MDNKHDDCEVTLAAVVRLLSLAIHDDEPNHLLTARRLLDSVSNQNLTGIASIRAVNHAQQLLDSYIKCCSTRCGLAKYERIVH